MDILENIVIGNAVFLIGFGIIALATTWLAPNLIEKRFFRWMLVGRLPPNRANCFLMALWAVLLGSYFLLSITEQRLASFIVLGAWALLAAILMKRRVKSRAKV